MAEAASAAGAPRVARLDRHQARNPAALTPAAAAPPLEPGPADDSRGEDDGPGRQRQRGRVEQHGSPLADGLDCGDRSTYQGFHYVSSRHAALIMAVRHPTQDQDERLSVGSVWLPAGSLIVRREAPGAAWVEMLCGRYQSAVASDAQAAGAVAQPGLGARDVG
jgi:hypothetical protein